MRRLLGFLLKHRTLALLRWDVHFLFVRSVNTLTFAGARIRRQLRRAPRDFLNLGSGPRGVVSEKWLNVDGFRERNVQFVCDFERTLPFHPGSFKGIFCEHVLEHFTIDDGRHLLTQCHNLLAPGGCLRLIVPDGEKILRSYVSYPGELVSRRRDSLTAMDAVNGYFRQRYEHQYIYDWETLGEELRRVGFQRITRVMFRSGSCQELALDDPKYEWESLYVEAAK